MHNVLILTNVAPHYRRSLWHTLFRNSSFKCSVAFGDNAASGIEPIHPNELQDISTSSGRIHEITNVWLNHRFLIWQFGALRLALSRTYSVIIFLGDACCLSTWLSAITCRLLGTRVVFWGHGIYGNESRLKLTLRTAFYRLANQHLLYERRAKNLMVSLGFRSDDLYVVFNSLDYNKQKALRAKYRGLAKQEVFPWFANPELPTIVFVGRLTKTKKLEQLLDAASLINGDHTVLNLVFIGDGREQEKLSRLGQRGLRDRWLHFFGACYADEEIGRYLWCADLCVSPGNVGLTAIHCLSFGTPVCTHGNLNNQGPEAEAISDGYNGFFFTQDDLTDLAFGIMRWLANNPDRETVRQRCLEVVDRYYNPHYQATVFERVVHRRPPEL